MWIIVVIKWKLSALLEDTRSVYVKFNNLTQKAHFQQSQTKSRHERLHWLCTGHSNEKQNSKGSRTKKVVKKKSSDQKKQQRKKSLKKNDEQIRASLISIQCCWFACNFRWCYERVQFPTFWYVAIFRCVILHVFQQMIYMALKQLYAQSTESPKWCGILVPINLIPIVFALVDCLFCAPFRTAREHGIVSPFSALLHYLHNCFALQKLRFAF